MSWYQHYGQRILTAEEAIELVKPGDRVFLGNAAAEPQTLLTELIEKVNKFENKNNIEITRFVSLKSMDKINSLENKINSRSFFINSSNRKFYDMGRVNYIPCFFSEIPRLLKDKTLTVDVAMIQVSLPDNDGYCSFGVSVDYSRSLVESAQRVFAEVNPQMPRTAGDSLVHVSKIGYFIPNNVPLIELTSPKFGPVEKNIALKVNSLIEDGSTIQIGAGPVANAIIAALKNKNDLGVHSDIISDGIIDLIDSGVVNGKRKSLYRGRVVGSFLAGTRKLYDFADNNPSIELYPIDYTNDPYTIGLNKKMVSISLSTKVDLSGQVYTSATGQTMFNGTGGQVDFIRGASRSNGGKSIIALPSTLEGGKLSSIVLQLDAGSAVSVLKEEIDYVVTENGIANLKGKDLNQRAKALIDIAHPDFQEYLKRGL